MPITSKPMTWYPVEGYMGRGREKQEKIWLHHREDTPEEVLQWEPENSEFGRRQKHSSYDFKCDVMCNQPQGNRQKQSCTVVSEASSFVGIPVLVEE